MYVCVTFLSHGAPDGDNEDTDDSENQQGQNATYHWIWNCAVSLHHCTRIWKNRKNKQKNKQKTRWLVCVGGVWSV